MKRLMSIIAVLGCSFLSLSASSEPDSLFVQAWQEGNIPVIVQALTDGANPNVVFDKEVGYPVIVYAVALNIVGHDGYTITQALVGAGARTDVSISIDNAECTLLEFAQRCVVVCQENVATAQDLLSKLDDQEENEESHRYLQESIVFWTDQVARAQATADLLI